MYFKKLELSGFKSFAGKTTLYFEPGVTTIVGPNGCGKSNIIDSIKWVLGEQSIKSMRGSKMEDVIFNGTDRAEPVNMAEVSLTLSNKDKLLPIDASEVVISRRLFRSGESEYLINKAPVRLKDVNELLMGTGIGAEAYSIIEQGKIDLIISSRPEDRRFIFEEASGITKYKSKKREAIRKLEATDENLLRVNDIVTEVKRQINSITRQAKKAERYKERFDRLKDLELKLASYEYDAFIKERGLIEEESAKIKSEVREVSGEIECLQERLAKERSSLADAETRFSSLQGVKFSSESSIEQARNKIEVNKERVEELTARIKGLKDEIESSQRRRDECGEFVQELEAKLTAVSASEEAKRDFLNEKEKRLEVLESEIRQTNGKIEESRHLIVDHMAERSRSKNEIVRLTSDIQNRSLRLRRLAIETEKVSGEAARSKESFEALQKEFEEAESEMRAIRSERDLLSGNRQEVFAQLDSAEKRLQEEKNGLITLESKKSFLEDLIERHEGFARGVKALLGAVKTGEFQADGIKGVLGSIIGARRGCELAVETALGAYAQCVVFKDREGALRAAEYLSAKRLGRAAFIILEDLPAHVEGENAPLNAEGVLGALDDFVVVDSDVKRAVSHLLKGFYLTADIRSSKKIFSSLPDDVRAGTALVTKRGEIFKGAFVAAGSDPKGDDAGIIGRESRLMDTVKAIKISKGLVETIDKEISALNGRRTDLDAKLGDAEGLLKGRESEYHRKESQLSSAGRENERLKDELSVLALEEEEIKEEVNDFSRRKEGLEKRLKDIEAEESDTQNVLFSSQEMSKDFSREREETVVLIAEIKTELHALSKEKNGLSQNLSVQKESLGTYDKTLVQKSSEIDESGRKIEELIEESKELEVEIKRLSTELAAAEKELIDMEEERGGRGSVINGLEDRLGELRALSGGRKDSEHGFDMKKSEIGFKLETLKNRMAQLYKVNIETDRCPYGESADWDEIRREIQELNRKLDSMGTVNLVAIEEHKELEDRFNFLSHQHADLTKAKEDIQKAIAKINKTTRKLFLETFEKIQFEFKNYFRFLFGGGQAEIFLIDERDVLECGIEIVVRPPGKKLQNITLLSGGEKALTAIALIYAIFKIKPSPFCLLDEVDAPLDESNIDRFSKALREFTKKSQFIVITHNKKTITLADVMYGITMEKSGISKIVSVKFHDEAPAPKQGREKERDKETEGALA